MVEPEPSDATAAGNAGRRRRAARGAGVALVIGVVIALGALLDLGPFADEELSVAGFLARGDEICTEAHDVFRASQDGPPRTAAEAAALTRELIQVAETELGDIRDLPAPDSLRTPLRRYLAARESGIEAMRRGVQAAEREGASGYEAAQARVAQKQIARLKLAREVGFNECSRPLVDRGELDKQAKPPPSSDPNAPPTVSNPPTG